VRPGSDKAKRAEVMHQWHKELLHEAVPPLIRKWEAKLGVKVQGYFLQRMKTKWGGCNHRAGRIRLNTELVKKPKDLLEYVIAHEIAHLLDSKHSKHFQAILDKHYPSWRDARKELNDLPLSARETVYAWKYTDALSFERKPLVSGASWPCARYPSLPEARKKRRGGG
jgi:predicted metal-dependent hydrolase